MTTFFSIVPISSKSKWISASLPLLIFLPFPRRLDLSGNTLVSCVNLSHLSKLKRIYLDNNLLCNVALNGLVNLELLSLSQNRMEQLTDLSDLKKLVFLDLSGNRLNSGFEEISKLKAVRALDLGTNSLSMPIHEFYNYVLVHLKKLPKLELLSLSGNPIYDKIKELKYFLINELPKLKYLDWEPVTKDVSCFNAIFLLLFNRYLSGSQQI